MPSKSAARSRLQTVNSVIRFRATRILKSIIPSFVPRTISQFVPPRVSQFQVLFICLAFGFQFCFRGITAGKRIHQYHGWKSSQDRETFYSLEMYLHFLLSAAIEVRKRWLTCRPRVPAAPRKSPCSARRLRRRRRGPRRRRRRRRTAGWGTRRGRPAPRTGSARSWSRGT